MAHHISFKGEPDYFARSNKQHTCYLTHKTCTWAQISRSDFSIGEAAEGVHNLSLQDQLVDSVDAVCLHYHPQLQTPDVWRARLGVQIPHCPICPVRSASYLRTCFSFLHKTETCSCQNCHFLFTQNMSRDGIWYSTLPIQVFQAAFSLFYLLASIRPWWLQIAAYSSWCCYWW